MPFHPDTFSAQFVNAEGGPTPGAVWRTKEAWDATTISALAPNTNYTFAVKARNQDGMESSFGPSSALATMIETPAALKFGNVTSSSIEIQATDNLSNLLVGLSGMYLDALTAGGDGGINTWIQDKTDTATGLMADTNYTFHAEARNQTGAETGYGGSWSKRTLAAVPEAPILGNPTRDSMTVRLGWSSSLSTTTYAIRCTGTIPHDATWSGMYTNQSGMPSVVEVWRTKAQWGILTVRGLSPNTKYTFAVKARNGDGIETDFGPEASLSTLR